MARQLKPAHTVAVEARAASLACAKRLNQFFDGRHDVTIPGLLRRIEDAERTLGIYVAEICARIDASERRLGDLVAGERAVILELNSTLRKLVREPAPANSKRGRRARS